MSKQENRTGILGTINYQMGWRIVISSHADAPLYHLLKVLLLLMESSSPNSIVEIPFVVVNCDHRALNLESTHVLKVSKCNC